VEDIHQFLKPYDKEYNINKTERCFRKIDTDGDDCIVYQEFIRAIRPIYCYKNYSSSLPQKKEMSPTKIYRKPKMVYPSDGRSQAGSRGNSRTSGRYTNKTGADGVSRN